MIISATPTASKLFDAVRDFCVENGFERRYWLAYSGGLDSHVLLHLLATLRSHHPLKLTAVHVNHGLSPNAVSWAQHCEKVCAELQIDFTQHSVNAKSGAGESPEEIARERRYEIFSALLEKEDFLLTAQHQDDQAETVLLQLFRGAGPKGLAAMPQKKSLGQGMQVRPLLNFTRVELQDYATQHQLSWIEDESNDNRNFSRNFIRHEVMPILKNRWPGLATSLSRAAENCAEAQTLLEEVAAQDLQSARGSTQNTLSVQGLLTLDVARQRQVLRFWLQQQSCPMPGAAKLQQIQRDFLHAREDKAPHMQWSAWELRRFRDEIFAMPVLRAHAHEEEWLWNLREPLNIENLGTLSAIAAQGTGLRADLKEVKVRFRQGGESCHLRGCTHSLKNLFQEYNIPPWERDRVPLLFVGKELIAAVGYFISEAFCAQENEPGYKALLQQHSMLS